MLPIQLKLKRKIHKDIAYAQDLIVETIYEFFPSAVIHGGTAIWRCYEGNRFSEDIDMYIKKDTEKINALFLTLEKNGFSVSKKRIKENSLYSTLKFNTSIVRFEALFKAIKNPFLKEYETSEGNLINIFTLSPDDLVEEKTKLKNNIDKLEIELNKFVYNLYGISEKEKTIIEESLE